MAFGLKGLFGERSLSKLAGVYGEREAAESAAGRLAGVAGITAAQLRVLGPSDATLSHHEIFARSVEPEARGIFRTILRSHAILGVVGAAVGVLIFAWLYSTGMSLIVASPYFSFFVIVGFVTAFAMMIAGLLSLRPDHTLLMNELRTALRSSRWAVVVHPTSEPQFDAAKQALQASGAQILTTL